MLTSPTITGGDIFRNGLFQNIFMLYELVEMLGYKAFIFVDKPLADVSGAYTMFDGYRVVDMNAFGTAPFSIHAVIEIGVGLSADTRRWFRGLGASVFKLYLGNVLNIDIEIPTCIPHMNISHHVAGGADEIWTSPHYAPHVEYNGVINGTFSDGGALCHSRVVPYVWSPQFIDSNPELVQTMRYRHRSKGPYSFTIIEPNISFQKCALIPLLILERLYRESPELIDTVKIVNGDRLTMSPYFDMMIKPLLHLVHDGKVIFEPRMSICDIMTKWPDHIVIANQILNEYNYIMMEHMHLGFPYVHNSDSLREFGYHYEGMDIASGVAAVRRVITTHAGRQATYRAEAAQLAWKFSPAHPDTLEEWGRMLFKETSKEVSHS